MNETTRDEHLAWCKKRALEYVDRGLMMMMAGQLGDVASMRRFIEGFN